MRSRREEQFAKPSRSPSFVAADRYTRLRPRSSTAKIDGSETIDLNGPRESPLNREGDRREIRSPAAAEDAEVGDVMSAADYRLESAP